MKKQKRMNRLLHKSSGGISISAVLIVVILALSGGYLYADYQVDSRAQEKVAAFVEDVRASGTEISHGKVNATLFNRQVSIADVFIVGDENEADIQIQTILVDVKKLQTIGAEEVPLILSISAHNGRILVKDEMIAADSQTKLFVKNFGDSLKFGGKLDYELDPESGTLNVLVTKTLDDFFEMKTSISLGSVAWLAEEVVDTEVSDEEMAKLMGSTLDEFSILLNNFGGVEKMRQISAEEAGITVDEFVKETTDSLYAVQEELDLQGGELFIPMIDEVIKFVKSPDNIKISIHPEMPLTSNDFMGAIFGGEAAIIQLLVRAKIKVKANQKSSL